MLLCPVDWPWTHQLCSTLFLPVVQMPRAWDSCFSLVFFCALICLESIPHPLQKREAELVMNPCFFFTGSDLAQVFQQGGEPKECSVTFTLTLLCGLVLSVPPGGPAWWHPSGDTTIPVSVWGVLGQSSSCRWNVLSVSGTFHMCHWRGFFCLPLLPSPLPCFPPCACVKGSSHVLIVPKGFHSTRDTAVGSSDAAECENTILDPAELTAHWGPKGGTCSAGWGEINAQGKAGEINAQRKQK